MKSWSNYLVMPEDEAFDDGKLGRKLQARLSPKQQARWLGGLVLKALPPWTILVGGIPTPLKNMKVNWDDDIPKIWKHKNHVPNHQPDISCNSLSSQPKLFWETGICRHVSFGRVASKRQPKEQIQIGSKQDAFSTNYCHKGKLVTPQNKRRHQNKRNKKQLITKTATKNIVFPGNSRINHGWCNCMWKTCRIRLS